MRAAKDEAGVAFRLTKIMRSSALFGAGSFCTNAAKASIKALNTLRGALGPQAVQLLQKKRKKPMAEQKFKVGDLIRGPLMRGVYFHDPSPKTGLIFKDFGNGVFWYVLLEPPGTEDATLLTSAMVDCPTWPEAGMVASHLFEHLGVTAEKLGTLKADLQEATLQSIRSKLCSTWFK